MKTGIFRKMLFLGAAFFVLSGSTHIQAQRMAIVDSEFIMSKVPEYQAAEKQLDKIAEGWQGEVQKKYEEIEEMYKDYQANQVLLTEDMRVSREDAIMKKERDLKDYQKGKFGYEGELFQKRQELVKPIQDMVYGAIQELAEQRGYDIILDRSSSASILYADPKFDKSKEVLRELGIKSE